MKRDYGIFHVGLKALLRKGDAYLFLRTQRGHFDLPGGRIDNVEYETPLLEVLAREIREELGEMQYKIGKPVFAYRRYFKRREIYVFILVYEAEFTSGDIKLSEEHKDYEWIDPRNHQFTIEEFSKNNQEELAAFKKYFDQR